MNRRQLGLALALATAITAVALALWRRIQPTEVPPQLPMPEPPEPPRIILPRSVLEAEEAGQPEPPEPELEVEAPLLERSVGGGEEETATGDTTPSSEPVEDSPEEELDELTGYCMHCRERRPISDGQETVTESGRRALSGTCPECGTRIFRFLPNKEQD